MDIVKDCEEKQNKINYMLLDTDNALFDSSNRPYWLINDGIPTDKPEYINIDGMKNIYKAKLGRMSFTNVNEADYKFLISKQIAVGFPELYSQSIIANDMKFHFVQQFDRGDPYAFHANNISITSFYKNRGIFRFREKFHKLDKLTLKMFNLSTGNEFILPREPYSFDATAKANVIKADSGFTSYRNYVDIASSIVDFVNRPAPFDGNGTPLDRATRGSYGVTAYGSGLNFLVPYEQKFKITYHFDDAKFYTNDEVTVITRSNTNEYFKTTGLYYNDYHPSFTTTNAYTLKYINTVRFGIEGSLVGPGLNYTGIWPELPADIFVNATYPSGFQAVFPVTLTSTFIPRMVTSLELHSESD